MKILPSYVEVNPDINNSDHPFLPKGISLLEYSMAFGSINIFRYFWVNKASYKKESLKYSIIGGNYGIVHILEEESLYKFDEENYFQSLKYYRSEISEYLLNLINTKNLSINEILSSYIHSANFDGIYNYLDNKGIFNTILSIKKDNILLQNEIQEIIKLHAFDNPWMPFYLFYNVTFQQSNIDVNWLNSNILSSAYDVINIFSINTDSLTML
ncbi:hypothetical protein TRFO_36337 [Tritrichomonas foetus]|uniref:DUF3447 domain-containing protein n=1 Tax=Tritrichomonas foetus TaxID=1144522 RepID=A0A1J4JFN5_9EUKA|nr:hypothetical protein TRFO_36337 [Tritrichomonas foetus]|eukprot:OHS97473.1 hypothetical protein TRFO_36337 [Tritrichomonas foetus]